MVDGERRRRTARNAQLFTLGAVSVAIVVLLATLAFSAANSGGCTGNRSFFACNATARTVLGIVPTSVLLAGALAAFLLTFRVWRAGGEWRIWHAAGWALFVAMSIYILLAGSYLLAD